MCVLLSTVATDGLNERDTRLAIMRLFYNCDVSIENRYVVPEDRRHRDQRGTSLTVTVNASTIDHYYFQQRSFISQHCLWIIRIGTTRL